METVFFGIDPGKRGAIAGVNGAGEIVALARFSEAETDGRIALIIGDTLAAFPERRICATIEKVGAMPGQGVTSMFSFGRAYGEAIGALILCRARLQYVRPQAWQKDLGLSGAGENWGKHRGDADRIGTHATESSADSCHGAGCGSACPCCGPGFQP